MYLLLIQTNLMKNVQTVNKFKMKKQNAIEYKTKKFYFTQPRIPKEHSPRNFHNIIQQKKIYQTMIKQQLASLENQQVQINQQLQQKLLPQIKPFQLCTATSTIQKTDEQFRKCFQELNNYHKQKQLRDLIRRLTENKSKKYKNRAAKYFLYEKLVKKCIRVWKIQCGFQCQNKLHDLVQQFTKLKNFLQSAYSKDFVKSIKKLQVKKCAKKYKKYQQYEKKKHSIKMLKEYYIKKNLVRQRIQLILIKRATICLQYWNNRLMAQISRQQKLTIIQNIHKHRGFNQFRITIEKNREINKLRHIFKIRTFSQNLRDAKSLVLPHEIQQSKYLVSEQQMHIQLKKNRGVQLINNLIINKKIKQVFSYLLKKDFSQFLKYANQFNLKYKSQNKKILAFKNFRKLIALRTMRKQIEFQGNLHKISKKLNSINFRNSFLIKNSLLQLKNHYKAEKAKTLAIKVSSTVYEATLKARVLKSFKYYHQNKQINYGENHQYAQSLQDQQQQQILYPQLQSQQFQLTLKPQKIQPQQLFQDDFNNEKLIQYVKQEQTKDKWINQQEIENEQILINQNLDKLDKPENKFDFNEQQLSINQQGVKTQILSQQQNDLEMNQKDKIKIDYLLLKRFLKKYLTYNNIHKNLQSKKQQLQKSNLKKANNINFLYREQKIKLSSAKVNQYLGRRDKQSFFTLKKRQTQVKFKSMQLNKILVKSANFYQLLVKNKNLKEQIQIIRQKQKSVEILVKCNSIKSIFKRYKIKQMTQFLHNQIFKKKCQYFIKSLFSYLLSSRTVEKDIAIDHQNQQQNQMQQLSQQMHNQLDQLLYQHFSQQCENQALIEAKQDSNHLKTIQANQPQHAENDILPRYLQDVEEDKFMAQKQQSDKQQANQNQLDEEQLFINQQGSFDEFMCVNFQREDMCSQNESISSQKDRQQRARVQSWLKQINLNKLLENMQINIKIANINFSSKRLSIFLANSKKIKFIRYLSIYAEQKRTDIMVNFQERINKRIISSWFYTWKSMKHQSANQLQKQIDIESGSDEQLVQKTNYINNKYQDKLLQKSFKTLKNVLFASKEQSLKNNDLKLRCFQGLSMYYHQKKLLRKYLEQCDDDSEQQLQYYPKSQQSKQRFEQLKVYSDSQSSNSSQQQYIY